jgi:hypothetical protein
VSDPFLEQWKGRFLVTNWHTNVLQINPRKRDAGKGQAELFNMLVVPEGILLLRFFDSDVPLVTTTTIKAMGNLWFLKYWKTI